MQSGLLKSGAFLGTGAVVGLLVGALLWRANEEPPGSAGNTREIETRLAAPGIGRIPPGKTVAAGGVGADEPVEDRTARLEALAVLFRSTESTRNAESLLQFSEVLGGISSLAGDDFPELFRLMEREGKLDKEATLLPLLRWAGEDPKAALAFAIGRKEFSGTERLIFALVYQVAKTDMEEAKAALTHFPEDSEEYREARRAIGKALMLTSPDAALAYARESKDVKAEAIALMDWAKAEPLAAAKELNFADPELRPALATIAESLLAQDRAAFESWAESLPDPAVRNTVRGIAMTRDALTDPAKAAQDTAAWLASDPAAAASAGVLSGHIAQQWWSAKASPRVVGDWAASLPAGPAQDAAVGAVGRLWLEQDTIAASGWMNGLAAGPGRDAAVRRLIQTIQQETPGDAFAWAATLHDADLRRELLRESTTRWAMKDHEAALSAVEKLPIGNRGELQEIISKVQFMDE